MTPALAALALVVAAESTPLDGCRAQLLWPPSKKVWSYRCGDWEMRLQDVSRITPRAKMTEAVNDVMDEYTDRIEPACPASRRAVTAPGSSLARRSAS